MAEPVHSIIPAEGWRALYSPHTDDESDEWFYTNLVCFAIVEENLNRNTEENLNRKTDDTFTCVVGMDHLGGEIQPVGQENFEGYVEPGEDLPPVMEPSDVPDWIAEADDD